MPDGRSMYYMSEASTGLQFRIMQSSFVGDTWSEPVVAPFSGTHLDIDPFITHDGQMLLFASRRPTSPGGPAATAYQPWAVRRQGSGWSEPQPFGPPVDSGTSRFFVTMSRNGTLYFANRPANPTTGNDIYRSRLVNGAYQTPEPVRELNTDASDSNPYVAPDESFIVFFSARPGGMGQSDLYVSHRNGDTWSAPRNLGPEVNTSDFENCPALSPDGRYLFFARGKRNAEGVVISRNTYYIGAEVLRQ